MQITVLDLSSKEAILIEDLHEELHKKKTIFIVQNTQMETEKKWIQTGNWSVSAKSPKKERTVKMLQHTAKKERRKIYIYIYTETGLPLLLLRLLFFSSLCLGFPPEVFDSHDLKLGKITDQSLDFGLIKHWDSFYEFFAKKKKKFIFQKCSKSVLLAKTVELRIRFV